MRRISPVPSSIGSSQAVIAACSQLPANGWPAAGGETYALLRALAFALGRGLPRADRVWATVAEALGGVRADATAIDAALQQAAPYIALDGEDGQSTYRLSHQTFAEHFHGGATDGGPARAAHSKIARALLEHGAQRVE